MTLVVAHWTADICSMPDAAADHIEGLGILVECLDCEFSVVEDIGGATVGMVVAAGTVGTSWIVGGKKSEATDSSSRP
jgi:hypothetical protein